MQYQIARGDGRKGNALSWAAARLQDVSAAGPLETHGDLLASECEAAWLSDLEMLNVLSENEKKAVEPDICMLVGEMFCLTIYE